MDKTPLERMGDEIAELSAHLDAATARLLTLIREFDVPEPSAVPDDPPNALRSQNQAHGLRLTPRSLKPLWVGERLDLGWAIDVLHPLARKRHGEKGDTTRG